MRINICCLLAGLCPVALAAQDLLVDLALNDKIIVQRHVADITIDGKLDEPIWQRLPAYDEFVVIEPDTLREPPHGTRVRFFYDDKNLYVGIVMDQPRETLIARLSGRDSRRLNRDSISMTLDTSGEGRYGYWFGISLGDSLMDGTVLPERQFSSDWDGAWWGESEKTDAGWSAEYRIPWSTVTMPQTVDVRRIGFYMSRKVAHLDERWGWPALPPTIPKFISALQTLEFKGVDPKQQFSVYPFTAVADDQIDDEVKYRVGADFFWRPSTNFQVTATVNPDFGIVESDEVVINLTATETFFPEKRLFFLEGQEVFVASPRADTRGRGVGNRGAPTTLINTRRIGGKPVEPVLASDVLISERELIQPTELIGALKLTGQYGRFRYGFLGAFEDDVKFDVELAGASFNIYGDGSDYGVARVIYEDNPGGAYRAFGFLSTAVLHPDRDAFTHGIDGHYLSDSGNWKIDGQMFMSDIDAIENGLGGFLDFQYTFRQGVTQRLGIEYLDDTVDINDLGFLQRNDNFRIRSAHIRTSSNLSWARDNQFDVRGFIQKNGDGLFTGGGIFFSNRTTFKNLTRLTMRLGFLPKSYDDLNSFGNGAYRIEEKVNTSIGWDSDSSKEISVGFSAGFRDEDLGGDTYTGSATLSWRPSDRFSLNLSVDYQDRDGWLLHQEDSNFTTFKAEQWIPKLTVDYFLSAKQQFRVSLQWVGIKAKEDEFFLIPAAPGDLIATAKPAGPPDSFSLSQISLQARYRWEIAPLSDIFVVYTRLADQGAALGNSGFSEIFSNSYDAPLANILVIKIRYRFGS
ncbi:MAG: DUF5916 domain-containing protein [Gammaproteobacteria bacterium]|nr:DUF5916 domain-containing protein [Gammaproteobacteria bacterium]